MDLEGIIEYYQVFKTEKIKYCMISLIYKSKKQNKKENKDSQILRTHWWLLQGKV